MVAKAGAQVAPITDADIDVFAKLRPGKKNATAYHRHVFRVLNAVFVSQLVDGTIEERLVGGLLRADLSFRNAARQDKRWFFGRLDDHHISAPYIFGECKNYKSDVGNPELDQLAGRLNPQRGQFGMLVCRSITDRDDLVRRLQEKVKSQHYIVTLTDDVLVAMIKAHLSGNSHEVDSLLDQEFRRQLFW